MSKEFASAQENGSSSSSEKGVDDFDTAMASMDSPPPFNQGSTTEQQSLKEPASSGQTQTQANTSGSRGNSDAKTQFGAPGSCWQTKKFHEEYERVDANLLDRNWNPIHYGDPLNPRS